MARVYSRSGQNVFVYNFGYRLPTSSVPQGLVEYGFGNATHGDELVVTFGRPLSEYAGVTSEADRAFTRSILTYWTNFMKFDNPNGGVGTAGGVGWQAFVANGSASFGDGRTIVFQAGQSARMQTGFSQNKCTFWNAPV